MITCIVNKSLGTLVGPFPISFIGIVSTLSGKKSWVGSSKLVFEAIPINIKRLKDCGLEIEFDDQTGEIEALKEFESLPHQYMNVEDLQTEYKPRIKLRDYQEKALALSSERNSYAYFLEMGLGKSAIAISNIGMLVKAGKLTGVLILSPKGVHRQWLDEQFPEHMDESINWKGLLWKGLKLDIKKGSEDVTVLSMNIDAIRTQNGNKLAKDFLFLHTNKNMIVIDESHLIKTASAQRTKMAWGLGSLAKYRRIMTGTPISKNVADLWSQFKFLDERILGHRYFVSFRSQYCIMGGFENRQIVGQKNTEELYSQISPHCFRLTKSEAIDLPEKIYVKRRYEMNEECNRHYQQLKKTFMTQLSDGSIVDVPNAVSCLVRLQQVLSGYLPTEDENFEVFSDDRVNQLLEIVRQTSGPMVVWARFTQDILRIVEALNKEEGKNAAVAYYGGNVNDRDESVKLFLSNKARFFVSNPAAGGTGLNLQSSGCQTVVYYNNDFNYITRMQSEDRTHRLGTKGAVTYFDLVAEKSVDRSILKNLGAKKSVSRLTLDEIRQTLSDE